MVGNVIWEVAKMAGGETSGDWRVLRVQAEAWPAEEDISLRKPMQHNWQADPEKG